MTTTAKELRAMAKRLNRKQMEHRGYRKGKSPLDGKPVLLLDPYIPTHETEARASEILDLRKRAARLEAAERAAA